MELQQRKNAPFGPMRCAGPKWRLNQRITRLSPAIMTGSINGFPKAATDRVCSRSLEEQRLIRVAPRQLREACTDHSLLSGLLLTRQSPNVNRKLAQFGTWQHGTKTCPASGACLVSPLVFLRRLSSSTWRQAAPSPRRWIAAIQPVRFIADFAIELIIAAITAPAQSNWRILSEKLLMEWES